MTRDIIYNENGLSVIFTVSEDGIVQLSRFAPEDLPSVTHGEYKIPMPLIELQITGKSTREMHGYKHNKSSASLDLKYVKHEFLDTDAGKEESSVAWVGNSIPPNNK